MSDHPVGDGRDDRPPSARARAELSASVASDVADARLRLQEAVLRAEGHRLLGDEQGLQVALADQDRILQGLQERLGRTASAAVLQRDAEEVVAAAVADVADLDLADIPVPDDVRVVTLEDAPASAAPRHAPLLSGVASVVALVAVVGAIVLGTGQGPTSPGVLEVAGQLDEVERPDTPVEPTTSSVPDRATGGTTERAADPAVTPAGPTERAPATDAPTSGEASEGEDEADSRTLERIVEELNEVVSRFGLDPESRTDLRVRGDEDGTEADDDASTEADDDEDAEDEDADGTDEDAEDDDRWIDGFVRGSDDE